MSKFAQKVVRHKFFEPFIITVIVISGVVVGLETSENIIAKHGNWLEYVNYLIVAIFIVEALLKMTALAPRSWNYFRNGWNVFDFFIIVAALIPFAHEFALVARMMRLLRVLRLISAIPELRLIIDTLIRSIPSLGNILGLLFMVFYIYAVTGVFLYRDHDPEHWRNLGLGFLTLFRVLTLEDWTDVMYKAMSLHYLHWFFFVSFVIITTFIVINMFIAIIINNLEETKSKQTQEKTELGHLESIVYSANPRIECKLLVRLHKANFQTESIITNIGHGGCRLIFSRTDPSLKVLNLDEAVELIFQLPALNHNMKLSGIVRNIEEGKYVVSIGIEFVNMVASDKDKLLQFIVVKLND